METYTCSNLGVILSDIMPYKADEKSIQKHEQPFFSPDVQVPMTTTFFPTLSLALLYWEECKVFPLKIL